MHPERDGDSLPVHVIDYLNREISEKKYVLNDFQVNHMNSLVRLLEYAPVESEFDQLLEILRQVASSDEFMDYFERNWLSCTQLWRTHLRGSTPTSTTTLTTA